MRVNWRHKERRLVTVGDSLQYDFTSLQSALDSISDSAADNPYVVSVSKVFDQYTTPVRILKSHIAIIGERANRVGIHVNGTLADAALWLGEDMDSPGNPGSGGERDCILTAPGVLVENVELNNLWVNFDSPIVGPRTTTMLRMGSMYNLASRVPRYRTWDNVAIVGCVFESSQCNLRVEGISNYGADSVPRLFIRDSEFFSQTKNVQIQGCMKLSSQGNRYRSDTAFRSWLPWYQQTTVGRQYCWLVNPTNARENPWGLEYNEVLPDAFVESVNDDFYCGDGTLTSGAGGSANDYVGAVSLYQSNPTHVYPQTNPGGLGILPTHLVNPRIQVRTALTRDPVRGVFGVGTTCVPEYDDPPGSGYDSAGWRSLVTVSRGVIDVWNTLDHADGPGAIYGCFIRGGTSNVPGAPSVPPYWNRMEVDGTTILVRNDKTGGAAYSVGTDGVADEIRYRIFSDNGPNALHGSCAARGIQP